MTDRLSEQQLAALAKYDTPTICNALSALVPDGGRTNVTCETLHCPFPALGPMAGYAKTVTVRSARPSRQSPEESLDRWVAYWRYLEAGPRPSVSAVQDLDGGQTGCGSFWGEINSSLHQRFGCMGTITDGGIRDLDTIPAGFRMLARKVVPSDGYVRVIDFGCVVTVAGMQVHDGDLVHVDRHGGVVIPHELAPRLADAAAGVVRTERTVIDLCRSPDFSIEALREAWVKLGEIA